MTKTGFPEYQDHIGGLTHSPDGQQRFYIDIGTVTRSNLHHHDYAELSYYLEGEGTETINGVVHAVRPGTASFLLPHHMHKVESAPGRTMRKIRCMFDMPLLFDSRDSGEFSRLVYGIGTVTPSFADFEGRAADRMRTTLEQLLEEYAAGDRPARLQMLRLKLSEALLLFVRTGSRRAEEHANAGRDHAAVKLSPLLQYVHLHYAEKLTLEQLSEQFRYSVPYLSRIFKEQTGKRFHEYVRELRMESAITMLLHTNMSVTDIAAAAGFDSFRTFARAFRDTKGETASEFRSRMRGAGAKPVR
ncbi:helix-turn-helix transcriptional regulator [Paenibacillus flagellatus]|uniref:HTH araC/xylS-type domain-containing protein n=1 Tax=Paenibacillus flagellatus TaxID=2211139 RepID=A0A2V5KCW9_9BACL|nr:AraC family transcriptional regulator [Paenibacillus flagellatus]PYI55823.1 hypothetical protein DLM86_08895 [Paenibacillus flagellatus]